MSISEWYRKNIAQDEKPVVDPLDQHELFVEQSYQPTAPVDHSRKEVKKMAKETRYTVTGNFTVPADHPELAAEKLAKIREVAEVTKVISTGVVKKRGSDEQVG